MVAFDWWRKQAIFCQLQTECILKQELMRKNDSIDYDNLTYGDILSTINKLGINMCNDEKLLKHQLKNKRKTKYEMGNFCEQYGLPPIAPFRQKGKKT